MRSKPGRLARMAAVAAVLIVAGLVPGAQAATGENTADARLGYTCRLASGDQPIRVRVTGTFPASGRPGRGIRPTGMRVAATLPRAAVTTLGPGPVTGIAQLTTAVTQNASRVGTPWPLLAVPPTPIPGTGDVVVTATGPVPPVTVRRAGAVRFVVGDLTLLLSGHRSGSAAPAPLRLGCLLDAGHHQATLAVVPVTQGASATLKPGAPAAPLDDSTPVPGCERISPVASAGCTYITGFSNVNKLGGAALIRVGLLNVTIYDAVPCGPQRFCLAADAKLNYVPVPGKPGLPQFPPSPATFLSFRFMPTRAIMDLRQVGLIHIAIVLDFGDFSKSSVTATAHMVIRLHNVQINGRPLNVGSRCQSVRPMLLVLHGDPLTYTLQFGGVLAGIATIPPFGGCGVGENLDPLITGTISGPGNYVKMTQGNMCFFDPPLGGCPPLKPIPQP